MWTFSSSFEAVHPLPPLTDLRWGGIFTPWTEFDWGGTDGGGLNSGGGGFFGDASGSRGSPPIRDNPDFSGKQLKTFEIFCLLKIGVGTIRPRPGGMGDERRVTGTGGRDC